jgi:tryptophan-rich sensory protein
MAVSAWLVWKKRSVSPISATTALAWFGLQLVLNTAWSWIFFAWRQPGWAFVEIVALWIAILMTILTSAKVDRIAAYLLVPYFLWVTFAASLNGMIWRLNS